jgi:steroid 5-alpha reductase family enzyme
VLVRKGFWDIQALPDYVFDSVAFQSMLLIKLVAYLVKTLIALTLLYRILLKF